MIESGTSLALGESSGSSIHSAWFALAISWQSAQGGQHD